MINLPKETADNLIESIDSLTKELAKFNSVHEKGLRFYDTDTMSKLIYELERFNEKK